ncbi:unnamed protein product [Mytilus coruscus]|uniref:Integrase catalytic domain-containing protein n=1 Tax=Mytilus coruscus TaxID=42192 RepID=A0A6J8F4W8_MYTCO|nr:unnamed protein product [Mytilus coruscus]
MKHLGNHIDLPKTQITRKPIPATYSNSRWQMDLKKMPPCKGYNYICNIVDCYSRFAFGGHLKQKTAKEVSELLLKFIYIFGPPRILQTDNGKEFNNADLCAVMDEFKTRKINGRPYHPQSQGRVERSNKTVVAYFRAQFVDARDWPSLLGEFYYKYNNRKNNEDQQSEMIHNTLTTNSATIGASNTNYEITSRSVHTKAQEIVRMDAENDYQEFVESLWNTKSTNMINDSESVLKRNETITSNVHSMAPENGVENFEVNITVQTYDRSNEMIPSQQQLQMSQPLQDITNSQMMRNTSLHQSENREEWDSSMYPEELFPKKVSKITEMHTFHPAVNEIIDFKPNSALSAGTNVFLSGYWKKGLVIKIENDDSKWKVYTIKELENGKIHQGSKYLIRPNLI